MRSYLTLLTIALTGLGVLAQDPGPFDVTLTNESSIIPSGQTVEMRVDAEGGNPDGWIYFWHEKDSDKVLSINPWLAVTPTNESLDPKTLYYTVLVTNNTDGIVTFFQEYDFSMEVWKAPQLPGEDTSDNVLYVSAYKIREGNTLYLGVQEGTGGYQNSWVYTWSDLDGIFAQGPETSLTARLLPKDREGTFQTISEYMYTVTVENPSPYGEPWAYAEYKTDPVKVYRHPLTPSEIRKGNGTSCTFISMIDLTDAQLEERGYTFVYGYTDSSGEDHILDSTPKRYTHTTYDIYDDRGNRFWVYSTWEYPDGSVVSSGRRYLDGEVDEDFDASSFGTRSEANYTAVETVAADDLIRINGNTLVIGAEAVSTVIYSADGRLAYNGSDNRIELGRLSPGIYIVSVTAGTKRATKKIIVK